MSHRISSETVVVRPRWAKLKHCDVRSAWLFLVPERVLFPCPISVEILPANRDAAQHRRPRT